MQAGVSLGPYEIIAPIGAGGMGEVYRARDHRLNRDVAVKVLPAGMAGDTVRLRRFETEARAAGQLNHPNILAVYDFGVAEGAPYLVTELLEGETLRARLTPGATGAGNVALPPRKAIEIAQQVARGLAAAHAKGIVHRDLKPENIFLTREGQAKILDFGLAKVAEAVSDDAETVAASQLTSAGQVLGTAGYMSPEQVRGQATDARSDLFALGAILYEMLAGRRAFQRDTAAETMTAVLKEDPPAIVPATGALEPALQRIVDHCVEKDPAARFQSARDLDFALASLTGSSSTNTAALAVLPPSHHRLPLLAAVAITAVVVGLAVFFTARPAARQHWHFTAVTSYAGIQAQPALSPDGRSIAYTSSQDGHFNIYVTRIGGASPVEVTRGPNLKSHPSWSSDGNTIAYARLNRSGGWDVWEVPALGGTPRRVVPDGFDPSFTAGGDLVYVHEGAIWQASASGEDPRQIAGRPAGSSGDLYPRMSPDGRWVAFDAAISGGPNGDLAVADVATGKIRLLTTSGLAVSPAWAPGSRSIYFSCNRGGALNLWKIGVDGSGLQQITSGEGDDTDLDISADGQRIVYDTAHTEIALAEMNLTGPENQQTIHVLHIDPARWLFAPEFSPDGKRLVFHTSLKGVLSETIGLANADGSGAVTLVEDGRNNIFPQWSRDGQSILFESKGAHPLGVRIVPVTGGAPRTLTSIHQDMFSPPGRDGRFFIRDGDAVEAVDPRTGRTTVMGRFPGSVPQWSPDQQQAVYANPTGVWLTDFHHPPRRIFSGRVTVATTPAAIYLLQFNPDLSTVLWKMGWNGSGLTRVTTRIPALWFVYARDNWVDNQFTVSPDGKQVVFQVEPGWSENIGMLTRSAPASRR